MGRIMALMDVRQAATMPFDSAVVQEVLHGHVQTAAEEECLSRVQEHLVQCPNPSGSF